MDFVVLYYIFKYHLPFKQQDTRAPKYCEKTLDLKFRSQRKYVQQNNSRFIYIKQIVSISKYKLIHGRKYLNNSFALPNH